MTDQKYDYVIIQIPRDPVTGESNFAKIRKAYLQVAKANGIRVWDTFAKFGETKTIYGFPNFYDKYEKMVAKQKASLTDYLAAKEAEIEAVKTKGKGKKKNA